MTNAPLSDLSAIATYLNSRGGGAMIGAENYVSLRAQIHDFSAHVNIQLRGSGIVRVVCGLPLTVAADRRQAIALALVALNRTGFGVTTVLRTGLSVLGQVPIGNGPLLGEALDRTIELVTAHARTALPMLRNVLATGLVSV